VGPAFKVAYINRNLIPSEQTIEQVNSAALAAAACKDKASLEKHLSKSGLVLTSTPTAILENDYKVGELQNARDLVKWAFKASVGQITEEPITIGDEKIVAILEKEYKKGLQDIETARNNCENFIKNKKKEEVIRKKIGNATSLEGVAAAYGKQVMVAGADSTLMQSSTIFPGGVGEFPKAIGAAFNPANKTKPSAIFADKENGVMILKINSTGTRPIPPAMADESALKNQKRNEMMSLFQQQLSRAPGSVPLYQAAGWQGWIESLVLQADVNDNRSEIY
ncbi:MAG: hypothetical protein ACKO5C_08710, partial [Ferruginibacter sp.]